MTKYIYEKGIFHSNTIPSGKPQILPESLQSSFVPPAPSIPRTQRHHREWVDEIKGGPAALSNFEYGARFTKNILLGVLSLRLGNKKIYRDAANMKAIGLTRGR